MRSSSTPGSNRRPHGGRSNRRAFAQYVALGVILWVAASRATAGDWPQILGPNRDGVAQGERLADAWKPGEPSTVWERPIGHGYAGAAIVGQRVVIDYRQQDEEIVEALDIATGKSVWRTPRKAHFQGQIFPDDDGPLCVPIIHGNLVLVYGAGGDLTALRLADGTVQWSRELFREFRSRNGPIDYGYFGAGSSPIVIGDRVLVNIGGGRGAGIIALALATGRTLWQATDEDASYSSPIATTLAGKPCVVFVTRLNCLGIDPQQGEVRFRFPFGQRGPTVNAASPVLVDNQLFVSSCYGVGAVLNQLGPSGVKKVWGNDDSMSNHYNTSLAIDGYLYGVHGRADVGTPSLRCVELVTGKVMWSQDDFGPAALTYADGKLLLMRASGELVMASPSPKGFRQLATAKVLDEPVRALPALSGGRLVVRDQKTLKCLRLPNR